MKKYCATTSNFKHLFRTNGVPKYVTYEKFNPDTKFPRFPRVIINYGQTTGFHTRNTFAIRKQDIEYLWKSVVKTAWLDILTLDSTNNELSDLFDNSLIDFLSHYKISTRSVLNITF